MTPSTRHCLHAAAALPAAAALFCLAAAARQWRSAVGHAPSKTPAPAASAAAAPSEKRDPGALAALVADCFAPADGGGQGALARRFRLAGLVHAAGDGFSLAILDDRELVRQFVVAPGDALADGISLLAIAENGVTHAGPGGAERIELARNTSPTGRKASAEKKPLAPGSGADAPTRPSADPRAIAAERFGGREVFPGRWAYDRERVIEYYTELRAHPERLLSIFDSMDPVWGQNDDGSRRIDGYKLGIEGEAGFFAAAGLEEGDVVLSVNAAPMNDRRRAEALITSFVEGRASTFVFEIERNGQRLRQVFEIE